MNKHSATLQREASSDPTSVPTMTRSLLGKYARQFDSSPVSFKVMLPDESVQLFGKDEPRFEVTLKNAKALRAVSSMDEGRFADAYVAGDIDIAGDVSIGETSLVHAAHRAQRLGVLQRDLEARLILSEKLNRFVGENDLERYRRTIELPRVFAEKRTCHRRDRSRFG